MMSFLTRDISIMADPERQFAHHRPVDQLDQTAIKQNREEAIAPSLFRRTGHQ
jgi:hypothetical protein